MLLRSLTLDSFGQYRDRIEIDLAPRKRYKKTRPVILIGGSNGAGKTTILQAIRLCLYGSLALGDRVSQEQYQQYLRESVHRNTGDDNKSAAVGLTFEYGFNGELHTYSVERRWECTSTAVTTDLLVLRDDKPLDELERAHADEFLRDLIPPGVSDLFFFDGEKIQELAESNDDEVLAESIRSLLGLDLVHRLHDDLSIYSSRLRDSDAASPVTLELDSLAASIAKQKKERLAVVRHADQGQARVDVLLRKIVRAEQRLGKEGGGFASERDRLKAEQSQLTHTLSEIQSAVRDMCGELFPFSFVPVLCADLAKQLRNEKKLQDWQSHQKLLIEKIGDIKSGIGEAVFGDAKELKITKKTRDTIHDRIIDVLDQLIGSPDNETGTQLVHRLSDDDRGELLGCIDRVLNDVPKHAASLEFQLEEATRRLQQIKKELAKVPDDDVLEPFIVQLNDLNRELGKAQSEANRGIDTLRTLDHKIAENERHRQRLEEHLFDLEKGFSRRETVRRVQSILTEYSEALTKSKIIELGETVSECFRQLWQKEDVLSRIEIDPTNCNVKLYDQNGSALQKSRLSAGEKQIYAISVLWALAKVSGRVLPMVVDTPLARLDSRHRELLINEYFPNVSHQVIILSTDTEIDEAYFQQLDSSISHAYQLQYDGIESRTNVEEGYFWSKKKAKIPS